MDKDEIRRMAKVITDLYDCDRQIRVDVECLTCGEYCEECEYYEKSKKRFFDCVGYVVGEALYNANCRIIADDEIVVKKNEYKELKKYRTDWLNSEKMHLQAELEDTEFELGCSNRLFQKVCKEKKELEKQLEQYKNKAKYYYNECKLYGSVCYIDSELE